MLPELFGVFVRPNFGIALENRKPHARRIELEFVDQQVPGKLDRVFFEIITERKIAEHFKERLMPSGLSHFVEVIVFTAGAQTLLRRASAHVIALLQTEKHILELIHARVGE